MKQKKLPWTEQEDTILHEMMSRCLKGGMTINASAKVAAEVLEEEGFKRTSTTCAFRWHNTVKHKEILPAVSPAPIPAEKLEKAPLEELLDLLPEPQERLTLPEAISYIQDYARLIEDENYRLRAEIAELQEIKSKYETLKGLLTTAGV
jgi:hypothetical protein